MSSKKRRVIDEIGDLRLSILSYNGDIYRRKSVKYVFNNCIIEVH